MKEQTNNTNNIIGQVHKSYLIITTVWTMNTKEKVLRIH